MKGVFPMRDTVGEFTQQLGCSVDVSLPDQYNVPAVTQTHALLEKLFPQCLPVWYSVPSIAVSSVPSEISGLPHAVLGDVESDCAILS
jgi:hypothetical protein